MHRGERRKPLCKGVLRLPPGPHPPSRNFSLWTFSRLQCLHTRQTKSTDAFPSIAPVRQNAFPRSGSTLRAHACSACTRHAHTAPAPLQGQKGDMQACRTRPLTRPALTKKILGRWMGGAGGKEDSPFIKRVAFFPPDATPCAAKENQPFRPRRSRTIASTMPCRRGTTS